MNQTEFKQRLYEWEVPITSSYNKYKLLF